MGECEKVTPSTTVDLKEYDIPTVELVGKNISVTVNAYFLALFDELIESGADLVAAGVNKPVLVMLDNELVGTIMPLRKDVA